MRNLSHANIVRLLCVCFTAQPSFIVLEYMPGGDLKGYLTEIRDQNRLPPTEIFRMILDVSCGLAYLSSMKYVHRDIAARNVLIGPNKELKISDFGMGA